MLQPDELKKCVIFMGRCVDGGEGCVASCHMSIQDVLNANETLGGLGVMCSVHSSLVFELLFRWGISFSRVFFLPAQPQTKQQQEQSGLWWTEAVGLGISSIASSSIGDRKKDARNGKRCGN